MRRKLQRIDSLTACRRGRGLIRLRHVLARPRSIVGSRLASRGAKTVRRNILLVSWVPAMAVCSRARGRISCNFLRSSTEGPLRRLLVVGKVGQHDDTTQILTTLEANTRQKQKGPKRLRVLTKIKIQSRTTERIESYVSAVPTNTKCARKRHEIDGLEGLLHLKRTMAQQFWNLFKKQHWSTCGNVTCGRSMLRVGVRPSTGLRTSVTYKGVPRANTECVNRCGKHQSVPENRNPCMLIGARRFYLLFILQSTAQT